MIGREPVATPARREDVANREATGGGRQLFLAAFGLLLACVSYGLPTLLGAGEETGPVVLLLALSVGLPSLLLPLVSFPAFLYYWFSLVLTQSLFTGFWLVGEGEIGFLLTEAKTVSIAIAAVVMIPRLGALARNEPRVTRVALFLLFAVAVSVREVSPGAAAYARNFLLPALVLLLVAAGTWSLARVARIRLLQGLLSLTTLFLAIGSLLEVLLGTELWRRMLNAERIESLAALSDSTTFLGVTLSRAGGFILEPVTAGYLATGLLVATVALFRDRRLSGFPTDSGHIALMFANIFVIFAAGTKSSLLMIAIALIVLTLVRLTSRRRTTVVLVLSWLSAMTLVLLYIAVIKGVGSLGAAITNPISIIGGDSTIIHWSGLMSGLTAAVSSPLGNGLGVGGNFYYNLNSSAARDVNFWLGSGGESAIGVLAFQTGLLGLVCFVAFVAVVARRWGPDTLLLLAVWTASALMAESMFGPQVASIFVVGAALMRETENGDRTLKEDRR